MNLRLVSFPLVLLLACAHEVPPAPPAPPVAPAPPARVNPLLAPSTLPFSLPPFDQVQDADFAPAFDAGMATQLQEVEAIANNSAPPTLDNTIVALERSGAMLTRVSKVFSTLRGSNTDDTIDALDEELAPKLSAHEDAIEMNPALFARIDALYKQRATLGLDAESLQLLERYHDEFVRAGAGLSETDKATLKALNADISTLVTQFSQKARDAMNDGGVVVDNVAELDGLSESEVAAAAAAATARGLTGKWLIALENTTIQPALSELTNRALRERIFRASSDRALSGEHDTTGIIARLVDLRAKKAALLGQPNFASYQLGEETAGTPQAVDAMLAQLGPAALAKAKEEAASLQAIIDKQAKASHTARFDLQPWDWAFYAEADRKARFAFDESQVKPYFELDHVLKDGVFYSAHELYGLTFVERKDLPVYEPSVRVFEVHDADGSVMALLLLDYFKRPSKQGGAWMDNIVDQARLLGQKPVVVNNLNIAPPAPGQPVLLSFDEVTTMFHEFGHGLHGLLSNVNYPHLSGTNTPPDFVEYPSQFNEMWACEPVVLANYAKHYQTGEAMPKALFDKVIAARNFGSGYGTLEYLEAAKLDMVWHELAVGATPAATDVTAFEQKALAGSGMAFAPVPPRYHSPYFSHVFGGGYEAGYYAYIWSEVLARDTGAWFHAHGGLTRANGDVFRAKVLSRGRTAEPSALFQDLYGGPPQVGPLLEYHGLSQPTKTKKK